MYHFFIRRVTFSVTDIVGNRTGENEAVLQHNAHLAAQRMQGYVHHAVSVNHHFALFNIIKAADQIDNGCFSRAGRADNGNTFARLCLKTYIL